MFGNVWKDIKKIQVLLFFSEYYKCYKKNSKDTFKLIRKLKEYDR